jgi:kynurenine formamidase
MGVGNERYAAGTPGPGVELGEWLVSQRVALSGYDTWSYADGRPVAMEEARRSADHVPWSGPPPG